MQNYWYEKRRADKSAIVSVYYLAGYKHFTFTFLFKYQVLYGANFINLPTGRLVNTGFWGDTKSLCFCNVLVVDFII